MRITQVSSGRITTQAFISLPGAVAASAAPIKGSLNPSARPPPAAAEPTTNLRRETLVAMLFFMVVSSGLLCFGSKVRGGGMNGRPYALIGAAAADVGHRRVDIGVGRLGVLPQERRRGHDLPRLTVAALRHVELGPGLLYGVRA